MQSDLLKTDAAAVYVGLSKPTLERLRSLGGGPKYAKLGGSVRYRKADLDEWVKSRLVRSTTDQA